MKIGYSILIVLVLSFSVAYGYSETERELKIGTVHLPPWGFFDEKGQPTGILFEIGNAICRELELPCRNQVLPAARLLRDLERNLIDFTIIYRTPNSERIGVPVVKVYSEIQNIVIGRNGLDIHDSSQLYGHLIAVPRGGKFGEPFDSDPHLNRIISKEYMHSVRLLKRKRVDIVVGSRQTLFFCADQLGLGLDFFGEPYLLTVTEEWVHFPKKADNRIDPLRIEAALKRFRETGELEKWEKKYLPPMYFRTEIRPSEPWPLPDQKAE